MLDNLSPTGGPAEGPAATWLGREVVVLSPTPTHPLDAGNRRRVFHLTRSLRDLGARIVFVHYPSESEWRAGMPPGAMAAMSAQWDECYTVPVTRPLHTLAAASDHLADEWWDPAIGHMLDWIFRTHAADALVVNYTWLTRAFEHCPEGVLRVLDTHDRFSGRRELLASAGIGPEFFHTTEAEERRALARAHVIWSIKPQEAAFFLSLGMRRVVNMPYFELVDSPPASRVASSPSPGGVLRFGLVGAANSINLVNTLAYLAAVRAYVARTLLPCEIVVAGSICDLLPPQDMPWIRLLGRLPDLARFYDSVDVVVAPVSVSTGLKIKVGEALCHGKAVVALAHAFEGYPARHPFHTLASLDDMMDACRQIVNRPAMVRQLELLSAEVARDIQAELARGFEATLAELGRLPPSLCVVITLDDVFEGSLALDHAIATAQYLGHISEVCVFVDAGPGADWDAAPLRLLTPFRRLALAPHSGQARTEQRVRDLGLDRPSWATLAGLVGTPQVAFWFTSARHAWTPPAAPHPTRAYINLDVAALGAAEADRAAMLSLLAASFHEVVTVSRRGLDPARGGMPGAWAHRVPVLRDLDHTLARIWHTPRHAIAILADSADDPLLALTMSMVARLSASPIEIVLARRAMPATDMAETSTICVTRWFAGAAALPVLAIDISSDQSLECAREMIDRSNVPCVTLFSDAAHAPRARPAIASGLFESAALLAETLTSPTAFPALVADRAQAGNYRNDAGWACIWFEIEQLARSLDTALAGHHHESHEAA